MSKINNDSHLTPKEYEIMKTLWGNEKPLTIKDLIEKVENISENSLHPTIRRLIDKGFIMIAGSVKVAKTNSRLYAPNLTVDEYAAMKLDDILKQSENANLSNIMLYFTKNYSGDDDIFAQIEDFVNQYKNKN